MSALEEQYLEKRRREEALSRAVVTPTGVPGRLPRCPRCDENELRASRNATGTRNRFTCAMCSYYFDCPAPDAPSSFEQPTAPESDAFAEEMLIGSELSAFIAANVSNERIRIVGAIHRQQVQNTLRNMLELDAAGEMRWSTSYASRARGEERSAIEHLKAVLARKEPSDG